MDHNELRRDYLLDRWVVIAAGRRRRPSDFANPRRVESRNIVCPFCPGNEHMTPPAVLVYRRTKDGHVVKVRDENNLRQKDWAVRCFPNLFPAFSPPAEDVAIENEEAEADGKLKAAFGHHEVVVESPVHDDHPSDAGIQQLSYVVETYLDRLRELSSKSYVKYVSIFRNHGVEAGASLSHAHSQIIAMPLFPRIIKEELEASRRFWEERGRCIFCEIIDKESKSPRFIAENGDFIAFAPWASVNPMEFWVFPKRHESSMLEMSGHEVESLAWMLKTCFGGLKKLLNDPPYNFGFHQTFNYEHRNHYHWHLEVYPKLAIWAGFEKSTGTYINTVQPEDAAENLRKAVQPSG